MLSAWTPAGFTVQEKLFDSEEGKRAEEAVGCSGGIYIGVGHCVLGYRDCEYPTAKPRKDGFVIRVVIGLQNKISTAKTFNGNKDLDRFLHDTHRYVSENTQETTLRYHKYQKLFPSSPAVICQILFSLISVLYPYI